MSDTPDPSVPPEPPSKAKAALRTLLKPVVSRLDALYAEIGVVGADVQHVNADLVQTRADLQRDHQLLVDTVAGLMAQTTDTSVRIDALDRGLDGGAAIASLVDEFPHGAGPAGLGEAIRWRIEQHQVHVEAQLRELSARVDRDLADVRSMTRLTHALVERALPAGGAPAMPAEPGSSDPPPVAAAAAPPARAFDHPVPSFDVLYRSFEDEFRGTLAEITSRQEVDYLPLLSELPNPELPIADLGCGRGELVRLLDQHGVGAVGIDSNTGQVADTEEHLFIEADLFGWLDEQADGSLRAVVALHVVEHLPLDLQIRLVFEARRVTAPGGVLILETPNALSLSTSSSNFWLDPTHERPVHPLFLEFLAVQAGYAAAETRPLHPPPPPPDSEGLSETTLQLYGMVLGSGDLALIATR